MTTALNTDFINEQLYLKETPSPVEDDIVIVNKLATFSDDDSSCSFDSEEDDKIFTPPSPVEIKPSVDIDWGTRTKESPMYAF